uniref:Putative projectin/twitchin n=1 Tax=Ixodes ricinus TaxID=34613 RepID=A0A0K8RA60_IXORI
MAGEPKVLSPDEPLSEQPVDEHEATTVSVFERDPKGNSQYPSQRPDSLKKNKKKPKGKTPGDEPTDKVVTKHTIIEDSVQVLEKPESVFKERSTFSQVMSEDPSAPGHKETPTIPATELPTNMCEGVPVSTAYTDKTKNPQEPSQKPESLKKKGKKPKRKAPGVEEAFTPLQTGGGVTRHTHIADSVLVLEKLDIKDLSEDIDTEKSPVDRVLAGKSKAPSYEETSSAPSAALPTDAQGETPVSVPDSIVKDKPEESSQEPIFLKMKIKKPKAKSPGGEGGTPVTTDMVVAKHIVIQDPVQHPEMPEDIGRDNSSFDQVLARGSKVPSHEGTPTIPSTVQLTDIQEHAPGSKVEDDEKDEPEPVFLKMKVKKPKGKIPGDAETIISLPTDQVADEHTPFVVPLLEKPDTTRLPEDISKGKDSVDEDVTRKPKLLSREETLTIPATKLPTDTDKVTPVRRLDSNRTNKAKEPSLESESPKKGKEPEAATPSDRAVTPSSTDQVVTKHTLIVDHIQMTEIPDGKDFPRNAGQGISPFSQLVSEMVKAPSREGSPGVSTGEKLGDVSEGAPVTLIEEDKVDKPEVSSGDPGFQKTKAKKGMVVDEFKDALSPPADHTRTIHVVDHVHVLEKPDGKDMPKNMGEGTSPVNLLMFDTAETQDRETSPGVASGELPRDVREGTPLTVTEKDKQQEQPESKKKKKTKKQKGRSLEDAENSMSLPSHEDKSDKEKPSWLGKIISTAKSILSGDSSSEHTMTTDDDGTRTKEDKTQRPSDVSKSQKKKKTRKQKGKSRDDVETAAPPLTDQEPNPNY